MVRLKYYLTIISELQKNISLKNLIIFSKNDTKLGVDQKYFINLNYNPRQMKKPFLLVSLEKTR